MAAFTGQYLNVTFGTLAPGAAEGLAFVYQAAAGLMSALLGFCFHLYPFLGLDARDGARTGKS